MWWQGNARDVGIKLFATTIDATIWQNSELIHFPYGLRNHLEIHKSDGLLFITVIEWSEYSNGCGEWHMHTNHAYLFISTYSDEVGDEQD